MRALFRTDENPEDRDLPGLLPNRWCGPDREKASITMFTNAAGDEEAVRKFGPDATTEPKLGGPSGPSNRSQFDRYPTAVREDAENLVRMLGAKSVFEFANRWLAKQNPNGEGANFGAGLTHEISKALAYVKLMSCLEEHGPEQPFVWDAIGNPDNYIAWIERAREHGYSVRILYVRCPLPVAQMWAAGRLRAISPTLVHETYLQAKDAATEIEAYARVEGLEFETYDSSEPDQLEEALRLGYSEADPAW